MASFRRRRGKWQVRVYSSNSGGAKSKTFVSRADAVAWAKKMEFELDEGAVLGRYPALRELIRRYRAQVTPTKKDARKEALRLNYWERSPLTGGKANELKASQLAEWRDTFLETRAPATVRLYVVSLSNVFNRARTEWGLAGLQNPCHQISLPKVKNARERRLAPGEFSAVLAQLRPEMRLLALLCRWTGMRLGEGQNLCWKDVDLDRGTATLHETKNGTRRVVPLGPQAVELLGGIQRDGNGAVIGSLKDPSSAWRRAVKRARASYEQAGGVDEQFLVDLRFHDLRHERTSELFELGLDVTEVALVTGHRSLSMLMRYTHHKASKIAIKLNL